MSTIDVTPGTDSPCGEPEGVAIQRLSRVLPLLILPEVLLNEPMDPETLQLGAQNQDLIGAERMVPVDDL
jgi:hypothetical protein